MANELAPVQSLEQAQVLALRTDVNVQTRRDNVLLYVTSVERNLIAASEELEKLLPQLKKAVDDSAIAMNKAQEASSKTASAVAELKYAAVPKALAKLGILGAKVKACEHEMNDGKHKFSVCFCQKGQNHYESAEIWLGTKEKKQYVEIPASSALKDATEKHKTVSKALADAQQQSLKLKCELQNVSRHEREGMANVIEKEREQTPEGRRLVEEIKAGAESRCSGLLKDIAALSSNIKQLTGKK